LHSLYYDTPSKKELKRNKGVYMLEKGKVYDIVLQNYPACNGACETHPWHLHGHHFWVVGTWPGEFNGTLPQEGSGGKLYRRDTVMVIGEGHEHKPKYRQGCGFTVIRFVADNPGAWPLHCHAEWHQVMGMGITLHYPPETIPAPSLPFATDICGDVSLEIAAKKLLSQKPEVDKTTTPRPLSAATSLLPAKIVLVAALCMSWLFF
jgi:L-ascorbate oxidase